MEGAWFWEALIAGGYRNVVNLLPYAVQLVGADTKD